MRKFNLFLLLLGLVFNACTNDDSMEQEQSSIISDTDPKHVYIAGHKLNEGYQPHAFYVKDGTEYPLYEEGFSEAFGIYVVNNDIYVAGAIVESDFTRKAALWVNGVLTWNSDSYSIASDVVVDNDDVYVVGYDYANGVFLRKNNIISFMENSMTNEVIENKVAVDNGNVYITGLIYNNAQDVRPVYWKNNERIELLDESPQRCFPTDLDVINGNVYISTMYRNINVNPHGTYFVNGVEYPLEGSFEPKAIDVNEETGEVYVAGYSSNDGLSVSGAYWVDGEQNVLIDRALVHDVKIEDGDLFMVGQTPFPRFAMFYVNGVITQSESEETNYTELFID